MEAYIYLNRVSQIKIVMVSLFFIKLIYFLYLQEHYKHVCILLKLFLLFKKYLIYMSFFMSKYLLYVIIIAIRIQQQYWSHINK